MQRLWFKRSCFLAQQTTASPAAFLSLVNAVGAAAGVALLNASPRCAFGNGSTFSSSSMEERMHQGMAGAKEATRKMEEKAMGAAGAARERVGGAKESAQHMAEQAGGMVRDAAHAASERVGGAKESAQHMAEQASDKASEYAGAFRTGVSGMAEKAKGFAHRVGDMARESVDQVRDDAAEQAANAENMKRYVEEINARETTEKATQSLSDAGSKAAGEGMADAGERAAGAAQGMSEENRRLKEQSEAPPLGKWMNQMP